MREIIKEKEPSDFIQHRAKPGSTFDNMPTSVKNNLRNALLKSQGYICCYCMKRIGDRTSKIEHFRSQMHNNGENGSTDMTLDYSNLFVACPDFGGKYEVQTCDSHKKEQELRKINLTSPLCNSMFKYAGNGNMSSATDDEDINYDIDKVLNLNQQTLKDNRKVVYQQLNDRFKSYSKNKNFNQGTLRKELSHWLGKDKQGQYKEYCMVAVYLIKKHMDKLSKKQ